MHGKAPDYLINKLELKTSTQNLRSDNDGKLLNVPKTKRKTFADKGFSNICSKTMEWFGPHILEIIDNLLIFRKNLKTYMF